ncbi:sensory protein TspO [Longibacter salinarum]|uniref:Sensory protein TspO n=1 Tax=Longibacter salinarum TaxID=1850348 RepID=A0A2A8CYU8_9BACT|nr:TspO/MBR family protein [Longibacter salinarum]PEN13826.1 sensory protein TspO [Longibacter salinarum]
MVRKIIAFVVAVIIPEAVGALAGLATQSSVTTWYPTLSRPWFTPPDAVFAPVWITLYFMMGVASWRVWDRGARRATGQMALVAYGLQLLLNGAWSLVFFGFQSIAWGLVVIVALLIAILVTMRLFRRVDRWAFWLLVPYCVWVAYATMLNASLWWLNSA